MKLKCLLSWLIEPLMMFMALLMPTGITSASNSPLCFTARNCSTSVKFDIKNATHTIQYSTNGSTWINYTSNIWITIPVNQSVYFRAASNQTTATAFGTSYYVESSRFYFSNSNMSRVEVSGNIMSLYGPSCPDLPLSNNAFANMFYGCTPIIVAPELPATTLAYECYQGMFRGCTSLTTAPSLLATTVAERCYASMFYGCTSLTEAPSLPATILAEQCYIGMFEGCTSLTAVLSLPAITLAYKCYYRMFYGCTSLTAIPSLPATTLATQCYEDMFHGCTSLAAVLSLPATTLANQCYMNMFYGCTSLAAIPSLPATTLAYQCYKQMFAGCSSLEMNISGSGKQWQIPAMRTTTDALTDMFMSTGGTMHGTPYVNTAYYIASVYLRSLIVNSNDTTMGTVCGSGYYYDYDEAILTATANDHYNFMRWSDGNTANPRRVTVTGNKTYTAIFEGDPHNITVSGANNGTVFGGGSYKYGTTATLTAVGDTHYHFVRWSDGNISNPRNVTVTGDATYTAEFEIDKHTIICSGSNGTVSGGGTYDYGSSILLTAIANNHYNFAQWSDGDTTNPRCINVTENATYTAVFEGDPHVITVSGTNGTVSGGGSYNYGSIATLIATGNAHYHFKQWSDGNTSNPRTVNVTGDTTYTAIFEIDKHTVTAICTDGTVDGTGTYDYGTTVTLIAIPDEHYHFVSWEDGDTSVSKTITVTRNMIFNVQFAKNIYFVSAACQHGTVTGNGTYQYLDIVTLIATPDEGYRFVKWSDDNEYNPRVFVVREDLTVEAICEEAPVIDDVEDVQADAPAFYVVGTTVFNPSNEQLRVYSTEGKLLRTADTDIDLFGYPAGIYIVTDNRGNSVRVAVK